MLNKRPVFLHSFARGGSNLLLNLLLSHPEACHSGGELDQVLIGRTGQSRLESWRRRIWHWWVVDRRAGAHYFRPGNISPRASLSEADAALIDMALFRARRFTRIAKQNRYKGPGAPYAPAEISVCRPVFKSVNGTVMAASRLAAHFPDASTICLVREGAAFLESYLRRGFSVEAAAGIYNVVGGHLMDLSESGSTFRLLRYEDLVADPRSVIREIYQWLGLDFAAVDNFRIQAKRLVGEDGRVTLRGYRDRELLWCSEDELEDHIPKNVNANQRGRLAKDDLEQFLELAGGTMQRLGYSTAVT